MRWSFRSIFSTTSNHFIFMILHPATVTELCTLYSLLLNSSIHPVSIIDITYIPSPSFAIFSWFHFLGKLCQSLLSPSSELRLISAWVAKIYFDNRGGPGLGGTLLVGL